ncbi:hypothetical protein OHB26_23740 [Nocardia sp. NBC_01503]|uniref:hypothetical protein n=1 Tax=Nocardia sp. NBC_01503 TaxID=2975997 RepID=UPI002E7C563F|nr:hypothetical protein [Nocardia sp. NBC_01503]WTL29970.1 hypothetical protein OHB26_23740 [Nocardia sp. NBC_01503]
MESAIKLEDLRSALSCVYEKLGAESLTEPDCLELVARAEVIQDRIDTIQYAISDEEIAPTRTATTLPPASDRLF